MFISILIVKATAMGKNNVNGKTFLEKRYSEDLELEVGRGQEFFLCTIIVLIKIIKALGKSGVPMGILQLIVLPLIFFFFYLFWDV